MDTLFIFFPNPPNSSFDLHVTTFPVVNDKNVIHLTFCNDGAVSEVIPGHPFFYLLPRLTGGKTKDGEAGTGKERRADLFRLSCALHAARTVHTLKTLWESNPPSVLTLANPRVRNLRNPRSCLICTHPDPSSTQCRLRNTTLFPQRRGRSLS